MFGDRLGLASRYVAHLADTGVRHGLIGPAEVPRLWSRHVLNCAVVHSGIAAAVEVADVGSGAGLPGIPIAIVRPDLLVHLVEPLLRRTTWLEDVIRDLGLDNVVVHRGRAQDLSGDLLVPVATARAVARLGLLARWCLPLVQPGGSLMALKGATAAAEISQEQAVLARLGAGPVEIETYGQGLVDPLTTVVRVVAPQRRKGRATPDVSRSGSPRGPRRTP